MLNLMVEVCPQLDQGEIMMSRLEKLTIVIWHGHYHMVWLPWY
jgi:hypothetical protein